MAGHGNNATSYRKLVEENADQNAPSENKAPSYDSRDDQVLALLNVIGQRLIASERERVALRESLSDLEAKSEQSERIFLTIQDKQSKIETQAKAQAAKIDKAAALADKIQEAIQNQVLLNQRLDKMQNERAHMIRKLERIEETVIETQDVLHSKTIELLAAHEAAQAQLPAQKKSWLPHKAVNDDQARAGWQARPALLRGTAMAVALLLAGMTGYAVYNLPPQNDTPRVQTQTAPQETAAVNNTATDVAVMPAPVSTAAPQSILNTTDAERSALFDQNPDALAAALNEIEPGAIPTVEALAATESAAQAAPEQTVAGDLETIAALPPAVQTALEESAAAPAVETAAIQETPVESAAQDTAATTTSAATINQAAFDDFIAQIRQSTPALSTRVKADKSLPPALQEIETQAFAGNADAQHDLAAIYTAGHNGVKVDYTRAAAWFTEAALQGISNARYNLGVLYHQGLGVTKDMSKAIQWYGAAAVLGHPEAQYNLGIAHIEGIGTPYNAQAAATYFENAAHSGIMEAAYNLGLIHENGLLGRIRPEFALYWYNQAAEKGSPEGRAAMNQLARALGLNAGETEAYIARAARDITPPAQTGADTHKRAESTPQTAPAVNVSATTTANVAPSAAIPPPTPVAAATQIQNDIQALRPEDKIDISEVARYIPPVTADALGQAVENAAANTAAPVQTSRAAHNGAVTAQIQDMLMRQGLYPGPADGINGPQTEDAIRSYQNAHDLQADGRVSEALLLHMMTGGISAQ